MDRGRRAEPYSNATIWTREIARNLAGHLDRLSKVHSCVDTASPKTAHHPQSKHAHHHPLKRVGQVSPLKLHNANSHLAEDGELLHDHHVTSRGGDSGEEREDRREFMTERGPAGMSPQTSTTRAKSKKKASSGGRRSQAEIDRLEALAVENQRLQEQIAKMCGPTSTDDPQEASVAYEAHPAVSHSKKSATQDYHKRHKQQQIWQENQALAKRLKNTKPTLSSKEWEKDDKWNQQFLKTQERRRQALHNEMTRTLASPHSALIRVKHVAGPGGSAHGRPATDAMANEDGGDVAATVIEVTTADSVSTNSKTRGVRRRRSSNEDATSACGDSRHYSTAANHRRIMELRKQREHSQRHGSAAASSDDDGTQGHGPTDELVSVRFTFSREGSRVRSLAGGLCTPNGVTGQFSPAIELESALESVCLAEEELQPVPILELLHTSRLDEDDDREANAMVFDTLQDCIDVVATLEEERLRKSTRDDRSHEASTVCGSASPGDTVDQGLEEVDASSVSPDASTSIPSGDPIELVACASAVAEPALHQNTTEIDREEAESTPEHATMDIMDDEEQAATDPGAKEMDASGYGSEYDVEEEVRPANADAEPTPPMPLIPDAPEEDEDEYEYDNVDEDAHVEEPATTAALPPLHPEENEEDAQYDDDLEPEDTGEDPAELSYSDDGFTGDD